MSDTVILWCCMLWTLSKVGFWLAAMIAVVFLSSILAFFLIDRPRTGPDAPPYILPKLRGYEYRPMRMVRRGWRWPTRDAGYLLGWLVVGAVGAMILWAAFGRLWE